MAGSEKTGVAAARADLYANAVCVVTPTSSSNRLAVRRVTGFWKDVGSRVLQLTPEIHDEIVSRSSHLPHIVSTALALTLAHSNICRTDLGPGGRDVTRLAGSSADVWTAIAHDNAAAIDGALAAAEVEIAAFRRALARTDATALHERFSAARIWFDD
jgi:prephenate dehydrogenase